MKPQPQNYTVHEVEGNYQVHTTYDLFHLNKPYPIGVAMIFSHDAFKKAHEFYCMDIKAYEKAKATGRSWPEND